jgi:hypothetical protein
MHSLAHFVAKGGEVRNSKIQCEIFCREECVIKDLTLQINRIKDSRIRRIRAQDLLEKVTKLLGCWMYEEAKVDCHNCQMISKLRKKTALFIIGVSDFGR